MGFLEDLFEVAVRLFAGLCELPIELPPLLLGPAELLHRRGQIQEVDRHDRGPRPEIRVPDQRIQLPAGLENPLVDLGEPFLLLRGVSNVFLAQSALLDWGTGEVAF